MAVRARISGWTTIVAGTVGWVALNVFAYIVAPVLGVSFGRTGVFFGSLLVPGAVAGTQIWVGRIVFFAAAVGWAFLYRSLADRLSGPGWLRGVMFGAGIWVVSGLMLPVISALHPAMARASFPGLLGFGFAGGAGVILSVMAHLVYGGTLGAIIGQPEAKRGMPGGTAR